MSITNPKVDLYLKEGCGRCPLGNTPQCKVNFWTKELKILRKIILSSGLTEDLKWKMPCYTFESKNILILSALNDSCTINFFKGALLKDPNKILEKPGENSQSARYLRITSVSQIKDLESVIKSYITEAIELERSGAKVEFKKNSEPIPEELLVKFEENPDLHSAFLALTPGRQRGYILFFSAPKQSKTRESRIEKCTPQIMNGKGITD